ncbi:hypothetical protein OX283_013790 [Flavobacterium sp. SUN052]|uniref:hypothetical protein n=1 Tax=Flavobacterium sp. SUN052 TaxID=3002441 RepID=UPI00237D3818|nr:hypothetical protein [Flavobacterium sp. SUN052]MEC4005738.1 hypothetical protein [Flavobacterium sp. SUN052]
MRKITLLFAFIGMMTIQSCTVNDQQPINTVDNDTISEVWEFTRSFSTSNNFSTLIAFPHTIYSSDMVLVYRLSGVSNGTDIWKLLPETYYFNDGTLDFRYDFDFTKYDASIFMDGFDLANVSANYRTNQVLRIVVIPGYFGNKTSNTIDFNDYNATMNALKINESNVVKIK